MLSYAVDFSSDPDDQDEVGGANDIGEGTRPERMTMDDGPDGIDAYIARRQTEKAVKKKRSVKKKLSEREVKEDEEVDDVHQITAKLIRGNNLLNVLNSYCNRNKD